MRRKRKDNEYWEGVIVTPPFQNPGNLAIRVRRPINRMTPSYEALHDKQINAINSNQVTSDVGELPLTAIYLKAVDGIKVAKRRVAAVNRISPLLIKQPSKATKARGRVDETESSSSDDEYDTDSADIDDQDIAEIQKTLSASRISSVHMSQKPIGHGETASISIVDKNNWQRDVIRGVTLSDVLDGNIPIVNFFEDVNPGWLTAVLGVLTPRQRNRVPNIMTSAPLGIVPIVGIPGGGKTHLLATVAMICLGPANFNKLMCCTPTHAAADALTGKLNVVSRKTITAVNNKLPVQQQRRHPIIIRAYHDRVEIESVLYMAKNNGELPVRDSNSTPWSTMHWAMDHSFAKYFLKVFGYGQYDLNQNQSHELFNIRRILNEDKRYKDVRDVLSGIPIHMVIGRRTDEQKDWPSIEGLIKQAMLRIALAADIIVSTTHGSLERLTKAFNKDIAKVTVIDEAGCVHDAEALIP